MNNRLNHIVMDEGIIRYLHAEKTAWSLIWNNDCLISAN
jgi:hypothetical protein